MLVHSLKGNTEIVADLQLRLRDFLRHALMVRQQGALDPCAHPHRLTWVNHRGPTHQLVLPPNGPFASTLKRFSFRDQGGKNILLGSQPFSVHIRGRSNVETLRVDSWLLTLVSAVQFIAVGGEK